jgi:hypothetical protein
LCQPAGTDGSGEGCRGLVAAGVEDDGDAGGAWRRNRQEKQAADMRQRCRGQKGLAHPMHLYEM